MFKNFKIFFFFLAENSDLDNKDFDSPNKIWI